MVAYEHHSSSPKNLREIWKDKGEKVINVLCISCTVCEKIYIYNAMKKNAWDD